MRIRPAASVDPRPGALHVRPVRFDEIAEILRLIERAIDRGCRGHYGPRERRAVFLTYARTIFTDACFADAGAPIETLAAERDGRLLAAAQLDPAACRLRALFVDGDAQAQGVGRALLAEVIARAAAHGCARLQGAMSLNAVPFYTAAGFRPCAGRDRLMSDGVIIPVVPMDRPIARS